MKIEQIYTGCLAEAAYYIESNGEAAIIDPLREVEPYLERADRNGAKIKYVIETHFHADFVSGHLDLANKTGASIVFGPTAEPGFDAHIASDGEELKIGKVKLKVLHTPGHTLESSTFLLIDEEGNNQALFTGDTLFLGDVGRPDLAIKQGEITRKDLAGMLFDSLRNKIMPLHDDVVIYPGHGAGSACGKKMSSDTVGTLGAQKQSNYALRNDMTKEEFIEEVCDGLVEPPQYFPKNAMMNKMGYESINVVRERGNRALNLIEFKTVWEEEDAIVIDTRHQDKFTTGFIPGSVFIGVDGSFATWVGTLVPDLKQPILFIAEPGKEEEVITRLARVGYDYAIGYLEGGIDTWANSDNDLETLENISPAKFASLYRQKEQNVLDVRKASEFSAEHIVGSENFPLDFINRNMPEVSINKKYYLHCLGGYRSVIASSILKARGINEVVNILEGYDGLKKTKLLRTDFKQQTTEL